MPGKLIPMLAAFDSPGAVHDAAHHGELQFFDSFVIALPLRHLVANVALDTFGQFLERCAGGASAAGAGRDAGRERAQAERLQQFAGGIDFLAAISAGARASSEMRMVSPIPSPSRIPIDAADQTRPFAPMPASVRPRCRG